ncbi:MAG: response regulator [Oscillibacter sp.]
MRIAICDDEPRELERLRVLLCEYETGRDVSLCVRAFENATDLLSGMRGGEYDLILLDVLMPGFGGIQAARELRELDKVVRILFLTSSPEFAVESYAVGAYHYTLKPATDKTLFPLLDKVCAELDVQEEEALLIKGRDGLARIPFSRLEYVEVMNKTVSFHLSDGSVRELRAALSDFETQLLSHSEFMKVHRSFLLNLKLLQSVSAKGAVTKTDHTVPVARALYAGVKDAYLRLLFPSQQEAPPPVPAPAPKPAVAQGPWRILLVDGEPTELATWSRRLRERGCVVDTAGTGTEALKHAACFDCVLLDVTLPGESGFDLCRRLAEQTGAPVIFLSGQTDPEIQLRGFAAGGVDYITKDTPADLFWAKVEARIRLTRPGRTQLCFSPLLLDLTQRKAALDGAELILTPTEFDLLWLLAEHAPHACTPEGLYREVWGPQQWDGGQTVQAHISRLRKKLESAYSRHFFLETVWGEGYRFVPML